MRGFQSQSVLVSNSAELGGHISVPIGVTGAIGNCAKISMSDQRAGCAMTIVGTPASHGGCWNAHFFQISFDCFFSQTNRSDGLPAAELF
jgi:hypothetical protein